MRQLFCVVMLCGTAAAVPTKTFSVGTYKDLEDGEGTGALLSSFGEARAGFSSTKTEVGESAVYCSVAGPDGATYLGTGDQGAVYEFKGGKLRKLAKLDAVLVTQLVATPAKTLYAATLPGGKVFAIDKDGKNRVVAKLEAEHVWALAWDEGKKTLYAGTGADGKIFAIDGQKEGTKPRLVADLGEKHVLSLALGDDGTLYAGSADQAIVYRVTPDGKGAKLSALHDFDGEEVKVIVRQGNTLYVAVNDFQKSGGSTITLPSAPAKGTKLQTPTATPPPPGTPPRDRKGKGAVFRLELDGRVEQLHALGDGYFTALHAEADGTVWAASGSNGRIYLIKPDRTVSTLFDFPERQVLTLSIGKGEQLAGTGDAGAVYRLTREVPKDASFTSKVFDAQFTSRWGSLRWTGKGPLKLETRTGNTAKPDKTWSDWKSIEKTGKISDGGNGWVASAPARYLQVRTSFGDRDAALRALTVYHRPQNQRARVTAVSADESRETGSTPTHSTKIKLKWKLDNPDSDTMVYRLSVKPQSDGAYRTLGGPDPLTKAEYEWNTESVPDGYYLVKVSASDERVNPQGEALEHSLTSEPILVDNRKPDVLDLKVSGQTVSGKAKDSFSPITDMSISIDGQDWQPLGAKDGIFDAETEEFSFKLPQVGAGTHNVAVRAVDSADNIGASQTSFTQK